ncbi:MAG: prepilin-type N-terminal cleavage/methylation domain-containing protein [Burkholderiales bacterium]|nr:prepilin-type N-terminal cleavage/methylation domain-containing protein [Burkholderiales bacterium]MDE2565535.1 prepilin-type N-terminal cleavage/methylation domain-containing protein [Burkholderiales bacterium]
MSVSRAVPTRWRDAGGPRRARGMTLLELLAAMTTVGILAAIALPAYDQHVRTAKVAAASADILMIQQRITQYLTINNCLPPDLAAIQADNVLDPWGRPYVYLNFAGLKGKGQMRKDRNLVPINTQYDLYSVGADGQSRPPLTAPVSHDDVILANDGNYIGLAANY